MKSNSKPFRKESLFSNPTTQVRHKVIDIALEIVEYDNVREYLSYYERRLLNSDNLVKGTKRSDCLQ